VSTLVASNEGIKKGSVDVKRAILSVWDKSGLTQLARALADTGVELFASGGTARALAQAGVQVQEVHELTGSPEILGGRVKTLHPAVHGGILSRRSEEDRQQLASLGWSEIDLVVVNLYPFEQTVSDSGVALDAALEQIDIGGVALLRAAAKSFQHVTVLCDPADYPTVLDELLAQGQVTLETRRRLAAKAFARTATYDAAIWNYLSVTGEALPEKLPLGLYKVQKMRYGENPHQKAALYARRPELGPLGGKLLQGKALSYNNVLDLDAAWWAAQSFERPTVVIVKHLSPCGIACADGLAQAFPLALASDPVSAFGGVVAVNRRLDSEMAKGMGELFVEAIAAPGFSADALTVLRPREQCRLLSIDSSPAQSMPGLIDGETLELRSVLGGYLLQERDCGDQAEWRQVTQRSGSSAELDALRFAWRAVAHIKSNAILLAQGEHSVGIGSGQPSRLDSVRTAVSKAGERARGAVLASDAFFPFPDGIAEAARAGVTAVVQPGGSIRDSEAIAAANELGMAMYFTNVRHFRH
jgi:phosphoribosylaminoimidazolecarboxamide formyltransferase/IMP cyclohydrolase